MVVALVVVGGVILLAGSGEVDVRLGDDVFLAGRVESLAVAVEHEGPIIIPDASPERRRDIYLQHLGPSAEEGWLALAAQAAGAGRDCLIRWQSDAREFVDPCTERRYPADGEGLTRYPTDVTAGVLSVDLRHPIPPEEPAAVG